MDQQVHDRETVSRRNGNHTGVVDTPFWGRRERYSVWHDGAIWWVSRSKEAAELALIEATHGRQGLPKESNA